MELEIRKLAPGMTDDYLDFFENRAFSDNPGWDDCYCCFYHFRGKDWDNRTASQNREDVIGRIETGGMHGFLAYADGKAVGWCHADDISSMERLASRAKKSGAVKTGAIVCFLIAPEYRRRGIAKALLQQTVADFKANGYACIEAYPRLRGKTDAENYHGPLDMYLSSGFEKISENRNFATVRLDLQRDND
jgi:GNAT superfamily N-acetyltransferase